MLRRANIARYRSNSGNRVFNNEALRDDIFDSVVSSGLGWLDRSREVGGAGSIEVYVLKRIKVGNRYHSYTLKAHGIASESARVERCFFPSSELSHIILAIAISQVSRTVRSESERYLVKTGTDSGEEMAPIASAAYLG